MHLKDLTTDVVPSVAGAYVGTKTMERFNMKAYQLEPEQDREREESVRPGPPFLLAAENLSQRVLGVELTQNQANKAGVVFHYLAGISWVPVYLLLRRGVGLNPVAAGIATGASMSLLLDETVTPAIGASASNREYPLSTHVRAFTAHLIYGLTLAGVTETGRKLMVRMMR